MKSYPLIIIVLMAICLVTLSCRKDKVRPPDGNKIYGTWQEAATAEDLNRNKQLDPAEIYGHGGSIWKFNPDQTGSESHVYEDTNCIMVTRVTPFVWFFQNNNHDIFINDVSGSPTRYLSPVMHIHSLSSTQLITKNIGSHNPEPVTSWVIMTKQ